MFEVFDKENYAYDKTIDKQVMKPVKVYHIKDDKNGYPHFLIYENGEWKYVSAKRFANNRYFCN